MSGLFTVTLIRKQIIAKYDSRGKKTGETLTEIPVVFNDLPYQTALAYRTQFPDNKVVIQQQALQIDHEARKKFGGVAARKAPRVKYEPIDETAHAATTGDFTAAINAELEAAE